MRGPRAASRPRPAGRGPAAPAAPDEALLLRVRGVVQGVGYRPFVHRLAEELGLRGWVRNERGGVVIHAEGQGEELARLVRALRGDGPPLARVDEVDVHRARAGGAGGFRIDDSAEAAAGRLPVPPDVAICDACAAEMDDPSDRRHRHPFVTCTDCGPRCTVLRAMPWDRARTTMSVFPPCAACAAEYGDPRSRRYHSQTNACPGCGPSLWLEPRGRGGRERRGEVALAAAARLLERGFCVAVRGLGGFHLAVAADDERGVALLRVRKARDAKPFAVMVRSLDEARTLACVDADEERVLCGPERPVVLLRRRPGATLARSVAPGLDTVGVMLAYTPLHRLLLEAVGRPLVMTSGNACGEPIAVDNAEARSRLSRIADAFLLHDREIAVRVDDSVVRVVGGAPVFLRRARGYAPLPLELPVGTPRTLLAVGGHLKNTFTVADGRDAWVSPHIGDLEDARTLAPFEDALARYRELFRLEPEAVVHDLHPGYLSTGIAERSGLPVLPPVQHHHAHVAAVLGEHGDEGPAIGLAFDGTGYGADGSVWGGEVLLADLRGFRRVAHLRPAPLPGGDLGARTPWRAALGYASLHPEGFERLAEAWAGIPEREVAVARRQIERGVNAPPASSLGRLFDAVAAVVGLRRIARYEGQAAMELEALAGARAPRPLALPVVEGAAGALEIDPLPLLLALAERTGAGEPRAGLAAAFHASVVQAAVDVAVRLAAEHGVRTVVLSGGCFQNGRLLHGIETALHGRGLVVLRPRRLGPGDGALSYGQAVVAAARLATDPDQE